MSTAFLNKVKHLCSNIRTVEWSGPLFYTVEGSIKKPETMKIILQDILPLDMGNAGYTEYTLDDRFTDYLMENEERMDWSVGHIHSHHCMRVFFSGVDQDELIENAPNHNYYVSLIVNNYMDFEAKIGFTAKIAKNFGKVPYTSLDENGKSYNSFVTDLNYEENKVFVYQCDVIVPEERYSVPSDFSSAVAEIMKPKPTPKPEPVKALPAYQKPVIQLKPEQKKIVEKMKTPLDKSKLSERSKMVDALISNLPFTTYEDLTENDMGDPIVRFISEVMKISVPLEPKEDLDTVLSTLEDLEIDAYDLAEKTLSYFTDVYERHFPDSTDDEFIVDSEEAAYILEEKVADYPFINVTVQAIRGMVKEFEHNATTV